MLLINTEVGKCVSIDSIVSIIQMCKCVKATIKIQWSIIHQIGQLHNHIQWLHLNAKELPCSPVSQWQCFVYKGNSGFQSTITCQMIYNKSKWALKSTKLIFVITGETGNHTLKKKKTASFHPTAQTEFLVQELTGC